MEWIMIMVISLCIASCLFTVVTAIFSILAYATVVGMKNSTHQIQWQEVPQADPAPEEGEDGYDEYTKAKKAEEERKQGLLKTFDEMHNGFEKEYV